MEEATYTYGGAAKILDIAESKLRYWAQVGFVGPSVKRGGKPLFTFQDLISIKAAKELVDRGFKTTEIRKAIEAVRETLPDLDRPLDRVRVAFDGAKLVIVDDGDAFETSGQKLFDFSVGDLAGKTGTRAPQKTGNVSSATRAVSPDVTRTPGRNAYDWFIEGTRAEATDNDDGRAERCYTEALALDPGLAAARTNLGSLAYRRGDLDGARAAFEAALAIDPDQPEARFNLANLVLEGGDLELAVAEFRRVLQSDPDFADAHYNIAVALERLGGRAQARAHLERYLALDPSSSAWSDQARALISRLE
jgi:DNA-binding transcriptional MerR regulator